MVVSWSPEPSKSNDEWLSRNSTHIIHFDEDSDEDNMFPLFGYELLPHDINNDYMDEGELESDSDSSGPREVTEDNEATSEATQKPSVSEEPPRQDIVINLDEVREAMSNITLPDSAIPPWAAQIPESQWNSFLLSRIRNNQNPN